MVILSNMSDSQHDAAFPRHNHTHSHTHTHSTATKPCLATYNNVHTITSRKVPSLPSPHNRQNCPNMHEKHAHHHTTLSVSILSTDSSNTQMYFSSHC
jgi:hypothetical protein